MIYARPEAEFTATVENVPASAADTLGVRIENTDGTTETARTTTGIVEVQADSGIYVATLTAPEDSGSYLILWDTGEDPPVYTQEALTVSSVLTLGTGDITPTVADVAALLRVRTVDNLGNEIGTFNDDTRPTGDQVEELIAVALTVVSPLVDEDAMVRVAPLARYAISLYAAMLVEMSYYGEQTDDDDSIYGRLETRYIEALRALDAAVQRPSDGNIGETVYAL